MPVTRDTFVRDLQATQLPISSPALSDVPSKDLDSIAGADHVISGAAEYGRLYDRLVALDASPSPKGSSAKIDHAKAVYDALRGAGTPKQDAVPAAPSARQRTTGINASNPVRVLPHIHLEDHHDPPRRVSAQDDCDHYKGKADALVFMEHGDFYKGLSCKAPGPVAINGSECYVRIDRKNQSVLHHTGIWFIDQKAQSAAGLECGVSPAKEKAAVDKAGGLLSFHHPEFPYVESFKGKDASAKALDYTLPKDQAAPFDMVEIWNQGGFGASDIEGVLKWTERNFYDRGLLPAVVSGLDDHGPDRKTTVFTMVDSGGSTDPDAMKAAIRDRKTWVTTDSNARVAVDNSDKSRATFQLDQLKPGSVVVIVKNGTEGAPNDVTGDSWKGSVDKDAGYAYAKIYQKNGDKRDLYLVTSPVPLGK